MESNKNGVENSKSSSNTSNSEDLTSIFNVGPYQVKITDVNVGDNGSPRQFRIFEPIDIVEKVPIIHFLHGFRLKCTYYNDLLTHLSSHGFIIISSQSEHKFFGCDTTYKEAEKVVTFINWLKENLPSKISVTPDFDNFGVSGHSRGGKVTNRILNKYPNIAKSFFGIDPVDSAPPMGGKSDPKSLLDPVQFKGESMFLGTEKGPSGLLVFAPKGDNSVDFYASYPSPSRHIIAANVGHVDMIDESSCRLVRSMSANSGDKNLNKKFIAYSGGLMAAFFNSTLKGMTKYEMLFKDSSNHPFSTKLVEYK
jgi:chlorophyllase